MQKHFAEKADIEILEIVDVFHAFDGETMTKRDTPVLQEFNEKSWLQMGSSSQRLSTTTRFPLA